MFSIFKRKRLAPANFSELKADMHSHILPGIDDGAPDTENSLELVTALIDMGFQKLTATPHILWDMYRNDPSTIGDAKRTLEQAFRDASIQVPLHAAAEYYMDDHFDELLASGEPLLTIRNNWTLVEFSFVSPPINLKEKIFELQIKGYQPIIAHPERYLYFAANKKFYDELKEAGCYFQLNILSLTGYYGKGPSELAQHLIRNNYIDFLGTDLHHQRHVHALRHAPRLNDQVKQLLDSGKLLNPSL